MSTPQDQLALPELPSANEESGLSASLNLYGQEQGNMLGLAKEQAAGIKQEEQQVSQMQPPTMDKGAMFPAPMLLALAAIGGSTMKVHARVMLGALNGMVQGAIKGDEMAYNQEQQKYQDQFAKMQALHQLQNEYYNTLYKAYGQTAEAQMRAFMMAHELTDDKFKEELALASLSDKNQLTLLQRAMAQQNLAEKIRHDKVDETNAALRNQMSMMRLTQAQQQGQLTPQEAQVGNAIIKKLGYQALPSGFGGIQQLKAKLDILIQANPGMSSDQMADMYATGYAHGHEVQAGATVLGRREAQTMSAIDTIVGENGALDLAIKYAKDAGIGDTKPIDWANIKASAYQNNPAMRNFVLQMAELRAEYQQALTRGGQMSEGAAERAKEAIPDVVTMSELQGFKQSVPAAARAALQGTMRASADLVSGSDTDLGVGSNQHKDGDTSTSKSGKPIIWKNGGWVYQ